MNRPFLPGPGTPPSRPSPRGGRRKTLDRRALLALGASVLVLPVSAQTPPGQQLADAITAWTGGAPVRPGRVKFDIAELVDNGNVVPIGVSVESPMTAADHVAAIAVFNDRNPLPGVATFTLGPRAGKAVVSTRMRLATTQKLAAVARMNDGSYWSHTVEVIVAIAACIETE
ncbi:MAG TPA: SoxY-related AACIE arm protein [Ramlibacter sp.]|nr:SoxY-related AACIE arm protein [Ramlibacter sp.]